MKKSIAATLFFALCLAYGGGSPLKAKEADRPVFLYFAGAEGRFLTAQAANLEKEDDKVLYCRRIIDALIEGPRGHLVRTLPEQTQVRAVYVIGRTIFVDFSDDIMIDHPGGIGAELLTVYSIVNSLVLNLDGIDRVGLLVEGAEAETLAGHVDIGHPLNAQMLLVR